MDTVSSAPFDARQGEDTGSLDAKSQGIVNTIRDKSLVKVSVYDNTFEAFNLVKEILHELVNDINPHLAGLDKRVRLEYRDRGKFEAEVRLARDVLLLSMHTNVFEFDRTHSLWKLRYVEQDFRNSYCGVIHMYNFLADSFKFNRADDLGYLVGRIFVNRNRHYFVEGKRQVEHACSCFGQREFTKGSLSDIVRTAMQYTLDFDLLAPPYDVVKIVSVSQVNTKVESARIQTGKRLGFQFNDDDVRG